MECQWAERWKGSYMDMSIACHMANRHLYVNYCLSIQDM